MAKCSWIVVAVVSASSMALAGAPRTLVLIWQDPGQLVPRFSPVRAEADRFLGTLDAEVGWEVGTDPRPAENDELRIQVVLMPSEPSGWNLPKRAMGVVLLPDRRQQHSVYLFYPSILRGVGLGRRAGAMLTPREHKELARALGRVLVHEVVHAVAPTLSHSEEGLMQDALHPADAQP